jgi:hypothetical protein
MTELIPALQAAGAVQLLIAAANVLLPGRLRYRENLPRLSTIVRQVFVVHSIYIPLVLLFFGVVCLGFAPELAGGNGLGRFLAAFLALFWLLRAGLQVFYYDREFQKRNRLVCLAMLAAVSSLGLVFTVAAWRPL